jgi:hypothetical protein
VGPFEQLSASEAHLAPDPAVAQRTTGSPAFTRPTRAAMREMGVDITTKR